jgi:hypothetical protein
MEKTKEKDMRKNRGGKARNHSVCNVTINITNGKTKKRVNPNTLANE